MLRLLPVVLRIRVHSSVSLGLGFLGLHSPLYSNAAAGYPTFDISHRSSA